MHRLRLALAALVLFATACGGSDTEELLTDLGLSEEKAACLTREYEARGLDVDKLLRADDNTDLTEEEMTGLAEVAVTCSGIGDTDTDTADDGDGDDASTDDGDDDSASGSTDTVDPVGTDDLSPLEQEFVNMLEAEGLDPIAATCLLTELEAVGFSIFDLAALGLNETAEPHPDMIAAFLRCGDEFVDAGITDLDDIFTDGSSFGSTSDTVETYGDDAEFDAMWDACAAGDWVKCDELYWLSPLDSEYEMFGATCALTTEPAAGHCVDTYAADEGAYGTDPELDVLYDACAVGDMTACDELFWSSPADSEYETFAISCGNSQDGYNGGSCADVGEPYSYGDDADLDADWDACTAGDMAACDALYLWSPYDSEYEAYGSTCGGLSEEELFGECEATLG